MGDFVLLEKDLNYEVDYMADNYTDELYQELLYVSSFIVSRISRLVLDIERFKDEEAEPMSKVGMSALYTLTSNGAPLRTISETNKVLLEKIYADYHHHFTNLVRASLIKNSLALIVDCPTFLLFQEGMKKTKCFLVQIFALVLTTTTHHKHL